MDKRNIPNPFCFFCKHAAQDVVVEEAGFR
jgi:hypothetical protein